MSSPARGRRPAPSLASATLPSRHALLYHRFVAERRLPFTVRDDEGVGRRGEIVIVRAWRPDLDLNPDAAFTIVLAQQPLDGVAMPSPNVAVCAPASPVRLPALASEPSATYDGASAALRLPASALSAYSAGALLSSEPLGVTPAQVFGENGGGARLDAIAVELLSLARRGDRAWQDLAAVLFWPDDPPALRRHDKVRAHLQEVLKRATGRTASGAALEALDRLSGVQRDGARAAGPRTADDAALARCLIEHGAAAEALLSMRVYLDGIDAVPGGSLAVDLAFTREQLSFVTLLQQPHQLDGLRGTFELFRTRYASAYARHHEAYWRDAAHLQEELDAARPAVLALARLNTLRALGRPVGEAAVAAYEQLADDRRKCDVDDMHAHLRDHPHCPNCDLTLDALLPIDESKRALRDVQAALHRQQSRLASEAVRRILARGGERLEQFLQIVQASDLAGLAQVLDDDLAGFLQELLAEPVAPTADALDLLEQLARAYPAVSEEQIDEVVRTLRGLLQEHLAAQRTADPARAAAIRLASEPSP